MKKEGKSKILHRIEEVILIIIISLNILEFLGILPADLDYAKKIISWTALGYLLYHASLTKIFFNVRHIHIDLLLIISYFLMIFKNIIAYTSSNLEGFYIFYDLHKFILENAQFFQLYSFLLGSILLIIIALYSAVKIDVRKPSLMHVIHEEGQPPRNILKLIIRFMTIFLVFIAFFIVVFNLIMEWLAIAIDAPLIMIALFIYLFLAIGHYKRFKLESLIYKIGEFGESFYEKFVSLFHYKKTIFLGISGMLVLHLLTDIGNFIIPYIFSFRKTLYFEHLSIGHTPLLPLFLEQSKNLIFLEKLSLFFIYILNVLGMVLLLLIPTILWYLMFKKKKIGIHKLDMAVFFSCITALIFAPVFKIKRISEENLIGVDILTQLSDNYLFSTFFAAIIFSAIIFSIILLFEKYHKKLIITLGLLSGLLFFAIYIYFFFTSLLIYYIDTIRLLFFSSQYYLSFYFLLFLTITILFYVGGFILYVGELIKLRVFGKIQ